MVDKIDEQDLDSDALATRTAEQEVRMEQILSSAQSTQQTNEAVAKIMADPDVLELLRLKEAGKKVTLQEISENTPEDNFTVSQDIDSMSNRELAEFMQGNMAKSVGSLLESKLSPLMQRLESVDGFINQSTQVTAEQELAKLGQSFPDATGYYKEMGELNKVYPDLSVQQLYILAKNARGDLNLSPPNTQTEHPTVISRPSSTLTTRETPLGHGQAGFKLALSEGIDRAAAKVNIER